MINLEQLVSDVIRPALTYLGAYSIEAEKLMVGTCAVESNMGHYLRQVKGPAMGIFQMEPATYKDILKNYVIYREDLFKKLFNSFQYGIDDAKNNIDPLYYATIDKLVYDLRFSTQLARIQYMRVPKPLPGAEDYYGQAMYWKSYYNTYLGKGTTDKYIESNPYAGGKR